MLKKSILFFSLFCFAQLGFSQNTSDGSTKTGVPVMKFDKRFHDFGTVKKGESRTTYFEFTKIIVKLCLTRRNWVFVCNLNIK